MNKDESIAVGQADFENTLTPEEAEEFDRLAEKLTPTKTYVPPTREQLLTRARELIAAIDSFGMEVHKARGALNPSSIECTNLSLFRSTLRDAQTSVMYAAGRLAVMPDINS